ncbi:PAS domain-containing protein [Paenibacillus sp. PSB04]|uniref:PAS domain-containing protein n=1 Tax=Paenibacillus sp. PSB04 TaxID=2866810 RepID=UPI0021F1F4E3|nr:PAS domain-containing protein [Paenibacillus sp. PSB04]UYO04330.1 PAS domain-containing protein [Paenibacillus sp. PSB04]
MDERLDQAPCGYVSMADNRVIQDVNATLCRMLGYEKRGMCGSSFESLLTRSSRIFFQIYFLPLMKLNRGVEEMYLTFKTSSGEPLPVLLNASAVERDGEWVYDCMLMPMRRRMEYEQQIQQAESASNRAREELERIENLLRQKRDELERIQGSSSME